jgi:hypothetical protein
LRYYALLLAGRQRMRLHDQVNPEGEKECVAFINYHDSSLETVA